MTRAKNALPTYPQAAQRSEKDENRGYLPVAGPSGAVKTGPTYLLHRVSPVDRPPKYLARSRNPAAPRATPKGRGLFLGDPCLLYGPSLRTRTPQG